MLRRSMAFLSSLMQYRSTTIQHTSNLLPSFAWSGHSAKSSSLKSLNSGKSSVPARILVGQGSGSRAGHMWSWKRAKMIRCSTMKWNLCFVKVLVIQLHVQCTYMRYMPYFSMKIDRSLKGSHQYQEVWGAVFYCFSISPNYYLFSTWNFHVFYHRASLKMNTQVRNSVVVVYATEIKQTCS
jgi:hypothetical protein